MSPGGLRRRDTLPRWGPFSPCAPVWLCASPTAPWKCSREVYSAVSSRAMSGIHYCCILLAAFGTSCNSHHCGSARWGCRENETCERGERCLAVLFLGCASRPEGGYSWTLTGSADFHQIAHSLARKKTTDFYPQRNYFLPYDSSSGLWQQLFPSSEPGLNFCLVCEASEASLLTHSHSACFSRVLPSLPDTFAPLTLMLRLVSSLVLTWNGKWPFRVSGLQNSVNLLEPFHPYLRITDPQNQNSLIFCNQNLAHTRFFINIYKWINEQCFSV